jgi:flagellar biogenesis protein FliO
MLKRKGMSPAFIAGIVALASTAWAEAALNLKKVNIVDGSQVELLFDGKVDPSRVKTEFVRDNIQLSLSDVSVYPAKVSMVSGSDLTKVFAYQYSPQLVRARFSVKGKAADYSDRLQVKITGKTITVRIAEVSDRVASSASAPAKTVSAPVAKSEAEAETEKKALLERILSSDTSDSRKAAEKSPVKAAQKEGAKASGSLGKDASEKPSKLGAGKSLPNPTRSIGVMVFVIGLLGLFAMFLKRLKAQGSGAKAKGGLGGFLGKLSAATGNKSMIEVVATHHLAPKRSIVVVRVQDRMLVLGMSNDSMNLISEFKANEEGDADENIGLSDFAANLKRFEASDVEPLPTAKIPPKAKLGDIAAAALGLAKPRSASVAVTSAAASAYRTAQAGGESDRLSEPSLSPALSATLREPSVKPSIRAQIRDRVQGMKPL